MAVFASSLLSLISPWGHFPGARFPPSPRCPRPVVPPPLPRRHSDPITKHSTRKHPDTEHTHRRHSDTKDLRYELENLNLNSKEVHGWLGSGYEKPYEQFTHDIPLQRSLSLDGGIEIFKYLQTVSDWSGTEVGSSWSFDSDERELVFEQYRSFEDIPVSPTVKTRRVSDMDTVKRNLALSVLKDSYKGIDTASGSVSPQIKKLQRSFTFPDKLEEFMEAVKSSETVDDVFDEIEASEPSPKEFGSSSGLQRVIMLHRSLSFRNSTDNFDKGKSLGVPIYRTISMDSTREKNEIVPRQRRIGVVECQGIKGDMRKEVMKRNLSGFISSDNVSGKRLDSRRSSAESSAQNKNDSNGTGNISALLKLRSYTSSIPTIVITDAEYSNSVAKIDKLSKENANTSNVELRCDCRICTEDISGSSFAREMLRKWFINMTGRKMGRDGRLTYWDENNNDSDMYKCVMDVMKLLFGLWLRHVDHN